MSRRARPFEWCGGHPALDLVNTLDERPSQTPIENLAKYGDLVDFVELAGLVEAPLAASLRGRTGAACALVAKRARQLREHLHAALAAARGPEPMPKKHLDAIAAAIQAAHSARLLVASPSGVLATHRWARESAVDIPLHACALAIEHLLVEMDRTRIRKCGAHDCDVYFIDTSKGRRRHWCSMSNCGNREKQRRWRTSTA